MRLFVLFAMAIALSACFKTQSEIHYFELTKKGGKWKVDKVRVVSVHYSTGQIGADTVFYDVGNFTFTEGIKGENEGTFKFDGTFKLAPTNSEYGPFEMNYFTATSSFAAGPSSSVVIRTIYDITHIKKNKMNLFVSKDYNLFFTQEYDFYFYFECTRL